MLVDIDFVLDSSLLERPYDVILWRAGSGCVYDDAVGLTLQFVACSLPDLSGIGCLRRGHVGWYSSNACTFLTTYVEVSSSYIGRALGVKVHVGALLPKSLCLAYLSLQCT